MTTIKAAGTDGRKAEVMSQAVAERRLAAYKESDLAALDFGQRDLLVRLGRFSVEVALGPDYEIDSDGYLLYNPPADIAREMQALKARV